MRLRYAILWTVLFEILWVGIVANLLIWTHVKPPALGIILAGGLWAGATLGGRLCTHLERR